MRARTNLCDLTQRESKPVGGYSTLSAIPLVILLDAQQVSVGRPPCVICAYSGVECKPDGVDEPCILIHYIDRDVS